MGEKSMKKEQRRVGIAEVKRQGEGERRMKKEQIRVGIAEEKMRGIGRKKDEEGAELGWDC